MFQVGGEEYLKIDVMWCFFLCILQFGEGYGFSWNDENI